MKPINELIKLNEVWLDEVYDRLWYEYFTPEFPLSPDMKKHIREQLNFIAEEHNKAFPAETSQLKIVGPKDAWENDGNGPLLDKKLYVDCKPAAVVPKPKPKKDLLGSSKPKLTPLPKSAKVAAPDGKTKYEVVAGLAAKGKNKDQIQEATGFERKTVTDLLWRWNKLNEKK